MGDSRRPMLLPILSSAIIASARVYRKRTPDTRLS